MLETPIDVGSDIAANCPVDAAIVVIAGKWKLHILRPLFLNGPLRYNDLHRSIDGIASKELTRNLHELSNAGLVERVGRTGGPGEIYRLTELGRQLADTFRALGEFGTRYRESRRRSTKQVELARITP